MGNDTFPPAEQLAIERRLRAAVDVAEVIYQRSVKNYRLVQECYLDAGHPYGTLRLRQAIRKWTTDNYIKALREFNAFVFDHLLMPWILKGLGPRPTEYRRCVATRP
jgi:hypothetical protein